MRQALTRVTCGGAPVYVWPGGGITFMVDVSRLPKHAFGYVPTPALVAPIEFTMRREDYAALGGHMGYVRDAAELRALENKRMDAAVERQSLAARRAGVNMTGPVGRRLDDGRLHFQHGPIDLIITTGWAADVVEVAARRGWERFQTILGDLASELPELLRRTPLRRCTLVRRVRRPSIASPQGE